jgi:hypothetical protein
MKALGTRLINMLIRENRVRAVKDDRKNNSKKWCDTLSIKLLQGRKTKK